MNCQVCGKNIDAGSRICLSCANQRIYGNSSSARSLNWLTPQIAIFFCSILFLIALSLVYFFANPFGDAPSQKDVEKDLISFLSKSDNCSTFVNVENFQFISIGDYIGGSGQFAINAWPLYASANLVCNDPGAKVTIELNGDAPCAYVRKSSFGYEIFIPQILQDAQAEFQREIDQAFDKMLNNM